MFSRQSFFFSELLFLLANALTCGSRWVVENRLDKLKFARQKLAYCYFSAAATLPYPELSDARISWAKNGVLTTVVDDFYDVGGSEEELLNLIQLMEKYAFLFTNFFSFFCRNCGWPFCFILLIIFQPEVIIFVFSNHRWDVNVSVDCCSEQVEIIFSALRDSIIEIGAQALKWQGRSVTKHIIEIVR